MYIGYSSQEYKEKALALAKSFGIKAVCMPEGQDFSTVYRDAAVRGPKMELVDELHLYYDAEGLSLSQRELTLKGDFSSLSKRLRQANLERELIVKAARIKGRTKPIRVIDMTAGMGEDSFLLAAAGFYVDMYERDPIIAALLEDALLRAKSYEPAAAKANTFESEGTVKILRDAANRITLYPKDSIEALSSEGTEADVIYLDPMFPERTKSALIKKKFQLLQQLESPCSDENELLNVALLAHAKKIVIKRPLKGPYLAGKKPDYSLSGKAVRFDCIIKE